MSAHAEMPQMAATSYASNSVDMQGVLQNLGLPKHQLFAGVARNYPSGQYFPPAAPKEIAPVAATQRRLVQIFIADPDENVPLDQCLLYSGAQKLTDLTDQELFFEIDVKKILDEHNAKRVMLVNKAVKERTEHLESARVRDLKMTVVTIASF